MACRTTFFYPVERSLDSYKFYLLHNKQLFINQLKTNTLDSRTIGVEIKLLFL